MKATLNNIYINRIILVGNGFDLAHGLKTRYEDFINWYFDQLRTNLYHCDSFEYDDGLCKLTLDTRLNECRSWRCIINMHKRNIWSIKGNDLFEYLQKNVRAAIRKSHLLECILKSISSKGWVDIENDYYELLKDCVDLNDNVVADLQKQLGCLQEKLTEYLLCVKQTATSKINIRLREIINEPVHAQDISQNAKNQFIRKEDNDLICFLLEESLILDFNYTKTSDLYHNSVIHIHGELEKPKSIIFGYGDELDENYKKLSNLNDNQYLTNMKSIRYLENGNYRDMLRFINSAPYQIYIMGHSCGNSDRTLLNTLFEHENCISVKIFYYQKDDEHDNFSEITQNMSRNFTDMQSFRDKVVNKTLCEPMPQIQI